MDWPGLGRVERALFMTKNSAMSDAARQKLVASELSSGPFRSRRWRLPRRERLNDARRGPGIFLSGCGAAHIHASRRRRTDHLPCGQCSSRIRLSGRRLRPRMPYRRSLSVVAAAPAGVRSLLPHHRYMTRDVCSPKAMPLGPAASGSLALARAIIAGSSVGLNATLHWTRCKGECKSSNLLALSSAVASFSY